MSRLLARLPYAEVAMRSRPTAPAPITIVAAALILLLSLFSALSRADETGTTFSQNSFICDSNSNGYWGGSLDTGWKNHIISVYRQYSTNLGRCPDQGGWIYWQDDIRQHGDTYASFSSRWQEAADADVQSKGGPAAYQSMFDRDCLDSARRQYGSYVVDARYVRYTGNMCEITRVIPNSPPSALNTTATVNEDTIGRFNLQATDTDGSISSYTILRQPSVGTITQSFSAITYWPPADWSGTTTLTFQVTDNRGATSSPGTVTIVVMPVNDPPVVQPVSLTTDEDTPVETTLSGTDIDSAPPSYFELVSPPLKTVGVATIQGANLRFEPAKDWNGTASFTYRARDPEGAYSAAERVTVLVRPINDAPTATTPLQIKTVESRPATVRARVTTP